MRPLPRWVSQREFQTVTRHEAHHWIVRDISLLGIDRSRHLLSRASFGLRCEANALAPNLDFGRHIMVTSPLCSRSTIPLRRTDGGAWSAARKCRQGCPQGTAVGGAERP